MVLRITGDVYCDMNHAINRTFANNASQCQPQRERQRGMNCLKHVTEIDIRMA